MSLRIRQRRMKQSQVVTNRRLPRFQLAMTQLVFLKLAVIVKKGVEIISGQEMLIEYIDVE